ncbi:uncharacterized protein [Onthophagus taurus]|uniref:uncharacterized protein n=1 Tax=Onthophagus taurus TaxID=166361 RepID=UPI0039BDCD6C
MASRRVRILLLGQTGVGKSTLVNMFGNYFSEKSVHQIAKGRCNVLVPTKFNLYKDDNSMETIEVGKSEFEIPGTGQSATQKPFIYTFNDEEHGIILEVIDTPGVGDTRGLDYDTMNSEMTLSLISELPSIDGICILLKPDVTRLTPEFEVCLKQIFEQLDKNIIKNTVFLYTHGRMRNFKCADTDACLRKLFADIQKINRNFNPVTNENTFFIDNETFKYIVGSQQGQTFTRQEMTLYEETFNISKKNISSLISYISNLNPAPMRGVASINEAKRVIRRLLEPLIKLVVLYNYAIIDIEEYRKELNSCQNNINELKNNMFRIRHIPMEVQNENTSNTGFNLSFDWKNIFKNFNWRNLFKPFKFMANLIFNSKTSKTIELVEQRELDKDVIAEIKDQETAKKAVQTKVEEMQGLCRQYEDEINDILQTIATFSAFIDGLKCFVGHDVFNDFMDTVIEEYNTRDNKVLITKLEEYLRRYKFIKQRVGGNIKSSDVMRCCQALFRAKHTGHLFKEIINESVDFEKITFIS